MKKLSLALCLFTLTAKAQNDSDTFISVLQSITFSYGKYIYKDTIPLTYSNNTSLTLEYRKGGGDGSKEHPDTTYIYNHFGFVKEHAYAEYKAANDYYMAAYWRGVYDGMSAVVDVDYARTRSNNPDEDNAFVFKFRTEYPPKQITTVGYIKHHVNTVTKHKRKK